MEKEEEFYKESNYAFYKPPYKSSLDKILDKLNLENDMPKYYKGICNKCVLCKNPTTLKEEIHDYNDISILDRSKKLCIGNPILILNNKWEKFYIYKRELKGIFYKWETVSGKYFILSQTDLNSLTVKEKKYMRFLA